MSDSSAIAARFREHLLSSPEPYENGGHLGETGAKILDEMTKVRPKRLYRYRSMGAYTLQEISSGNIYLGRPSMMNDPLEGVVVATHEVLTRCLSTPSSRSLGFSSTGHLFWHQIGYLRDQFRMCCFVDNPLSILMWSHYGGNHAGLCLEYDLSAECHSDFMSWDFNNHSTILGRILPITYTDSAVQFDHWIEALSSEHAAFIETGWMGMALLLSKRAHWSHEAEWRFLAHRHSELGFSMSEGLPYLKLSRIIFGMKTSPDDEKRVEECLSRMRFPIAKSRVSYDFEAGILVVVPSNRD